MLYFPYVGRSEIYSTVVKYGWSRIPGSSATVVSLMEWTPGPLHNLQPNFFCGRRRSDIVCLDLVGLEDVGVAAAENICLRLRWILPLVMERRNEYLLTSRVGHVDGKIQADWYIGFPRQGKLYVDNSNYFQYPCSYATLVFLYFDDLDLQRPDQYDPIGQMFPRSSHNTRQ